jgi:hypothetical protein
MSETLMILPLVMNVGSLEAADAEPLAEEALLESTLELLLPPQPARAKHSAANTHAHIAAKVTFFFMPSSFLSLHPNSTRTP